MRTTRKYILISLTFLVLGGCSESEPGSAVTAPEAAAAIAEAFVPAADQYGIERFKVVYDLLGQETGTRTLWVEDHGNRVGMEDQVTVYGQVQHKLYYWDGERGHLKELPDGQTFSTKLRMKASEPTSFATLPASSLETAGYTRVGDRELLGKTCEHWKNERFNYEGCRWQRIELEFKNGAGTDKILQTQVATALVEGEGIPARIKALAEGR